MKLFDELEKYCNNNGIGLQIDVFRKDKNRYELTLDNFSPEELKNIRNIISDYAKIEDDVYLAGNGRAIDIYFETLDESKTSARKSIKESKDITVEEFISDYKNNDCFSIRDKENGHESECFWGNKKDVLDSDYRLFTVLDTDVDKETDDVVLYIDLEENAWTESKKSTRKSIKESKGADKLDVLSLCYYCAEDVDVEIYSYYNANDEVKLLDSFKRKNYLGSAYKYNQIESFEIDGNTMIIYLEQDTEIM